MKHILYSITFCLMAITVNSQIAIGKNSVEGTATILDFDNPTSNFRGIILPAVDDAEDSTLDENNNGTFLFDRIDNKLKMYENDDWVELSDAGSSTGLLNNTATESGDGVIIGAEQTDAIGILVLESEDKALKLPRVANPHLTIKSPIVGTMCYDTVSKSLAIFDGSNWNYWK